MRWRPIIVLLLFNIALQVVLTAANGAVARWSVSLHLDVLYLIVAAIHLPGTAAFLAILFQGLLVDAWWPVSDGQVPTVYGAVFLLMFAFRKHLRRDHPVQLALVAVLCNLLVLLWLAVWIGPTGADPILYVMRIVQDGLLSTLVLLVVLPRFLQFARWVFRVAGEDLTKIPPPR